MRKRESPGFTSAGSASGEPRESKAPTPAISRWTGCAPKTWPRKSPPGAICSWKKKRSWPGTRTSFSSMAAASAMSSRISRKSRNFTATSKPSEPEGSPSVPLQLVRDQYRHGHRRRLRRRKNPLSGNLSRSGSPQEGRRNLHLPPGQARLRANGKGIREARRTRPFSSISAKCTHRRTWN